MIKNSKYIGRRYGRLVVTGRAEDDANGRSHWLCKCDCGGTKVVKINCLYSGSTRSCGCLLVKHGMYTTKEYKVWEAMLRRCNNPKDTGYSRYGGRGIKVCDRWLKFENFHNDMGFKPEPNLQIDRINNNEGYYPGNCRWATCAENVRNSRTAKLTKDSVSAIKNLLLSGGMPQKSIGIIFGVKQPTISGIKRRKTWWDVKPLVF